MAQARASRPSLGRGATAFGATRRLGDGTRGHSEASQGLAADARGRSESSTLVLATVTPLRSRMAQEKDRIRLMSSQEIGDDMERMLNAAASAEPHQAPHGSRAPVTPPWRRAQASSGGQDASSGGQAASSDGQVAAWQQDDWQQDDWQEDDAWVAEALWYYQEDQREEGETTGDGEERQAPPPKRRAESKVGSKRKNADGTSRPRGGRRSDPQYRDVMKSRYVGKGDAGEKHRQEQEKLRRQEQQKSRG